MSFMLKDPDLEKGSDGDLANENRRPSYRPRVSKMDTSCNSMIYYSASGTTTPDFLNTLSGTDKGRKPLDADAVLEAVIEVVPARARTTRPCLLQPCIHHFPQF